MPFVFLSSLLCVFALSSSPAHARYSFGTDEYLNFIQDVAIKGAKGESLYLGYKYSFYNFLLPYTLSDDGYVLGVKGESKSYYRLDQASVEKFQAAGLLPSPLPAYEISPFDYAVGHIVWAVPAFMIGAFVIKLPGRRRRQRAASYLQSGLGLDRNGDLDGAITDYTKALDIDPVCLPALISRATAYERRGGFDHGDLDRGDLDRGDLDRAVADFTAAIDLSTGPARVSLHISRGLVQQKKGDFDRAIADYSHAIELSKAPAAWFNRGNAFAARGDYASAIADYSKALELQPDAAPACEARASAYEAQGDTARAAADRARAAELTAGSAHTFAAAS